MSKISIKSEEDVEGIRQASKVTAQILDAVGEIVRPGVSTEEINTFVHKMTLDLGAKPAPLNYHGFPKSVCTSVNEVVCHGIPSPYQQLQEGDIVNVDVTSIKEGYFGDASRMYFIGGPDACSEEARTLVEITKQALQVGIEQVRPGAHFGDIGAAIEEFIEATEKGYGIVREY
ncbi:MAG: type I methionyl aminopeptidase, partial [Bdellovibrionales bacterium]|nr:type I methionyl aminopeptidase [Bdellovibrionales bacterium]